MTSVTEEQNAILVKVRSGLATQSLTLGTAQHAILAGTLKSGGGKRSVADTMRSVEMPALPGNNRMRRFIGLDHAYILERILI